MNASIWIYESLYTSKLTYREGGIERERENIQTYIQRGGIERERERERERYIYIYIYHVLESATAWRAGFLE